MSGCSFVDEPQAARYACTRDEPACPDGQTCILDVGGSEGFCGLVDVCHVPSNDRFAGPVNDCVPCDPGGTGVPSGVCIAGRCTVDRCDTTCRVAACGDGCLDPGEFCDDDNSLDEDGCSGRCSVEPGWTCEADEPSTCAATRCGDGTVAVGSEPCDDGDDPNPADHCFACRAVEWVPVPSVPALPPSPPGPTLRVRTGEHCVDVCDVGGSCSTIAGLCGQPGRLGAHLYEPHAAIAGVEPGTYYVADTGNDRVLRIDGNGQTLVVGNGDPSVVGTGSPSRSLPTASPRALALDGWGNLFIVARSRAEGRPERGVLREVANVGGDVAADADGADLLLKIDGCATDDEDITDVVVVGDVLRLGVSGSVRGCARVVE
jgi:cysteine-rich repeat protein